MTIPELRAMLEVLTDEDLLAVLPLGRLGLRYLQLKQRVAELEAALAVFTHAWDTDNRPPPHVIELGRQCQARRDEP